MLGCQRLGAVLSASCCRQRCRRIFTGMRLGLGFAWVVIVVGEMTGVQTGLGAIIMEARQLSRTEIVISGMIVIGALPAFFPTSLYAARATAPALESRRMAEAADPILEMRGRRQAIRSSGANRSRRCATPICA